MAWDDADIVKALIPDKKSEAGNLPKLVVLKGFFSTLAKPASGPQKCRVYLNHALSDYYEFEDVADIRYVAKISEEEGQRVWVRHGAQVRLVRSRATEAEGPPLLDGVIAQTRLAGAPAAQPRWVPGMYQGSGTPMAGIDWLPADDPGFEVTTCKTNCFSTSP